MKVDGRLVDAYYFCLGGALGLHQATARPVGYRCLATEVPESIERLLRLYLTARQAGENLRQFFVRHSDTELREFLAGKSVDAVTRDLPPANARGAIAHAAGGDGD
jgi:sulfite reductase (ferredoxin)